MHRGLKSSLVVGVTCHEAVWAGPVVDPTAGDVPSALERVPCPGPFPRPVDPCARWIL